MLSKVGKGTDSDEMVGIMKLSGQNEKKNAGEQKAAAEKGTLVQTRERKSGETKKVATVDNFRNDIMQHTRTPFLTIPGSNSMLTIRWIGREGR